jgi:cell division protein FtsW
MTTARKGLRFDVALCMGVFALVGLGVVLIYSSSAPLAAAKGLPESFYLAQHFKKVVIGMLAFMVGLTVPYKIWERLSLPLLGVSLALLLYIVVTSVGSINGASRWVFGIQPSELAKISLIIFMARRLSLKASVMPQFANGLLASLIVPATVAFLILLQPNYSMVLMLCGITTAMVFLGGARIGHLATLAVGALPLLAVVMVSSAYRMKRVMAFLDPSANTASSHQSQHALISLGSGGLIGTGLGEGTQKLGYLPMPFTDTVFAILGEELGFVGTMAVLSLFGLVVWRGLRVARSCPDSFGSLLAAGLSVSIALSVIVHVGVCVKLFPTTGQPLPFVSYGGTSLIMNLLGMGILLNISGASATPIEPPPPLVWRAARRSSPLRPFSPQRGASAPAAATSLSGAFFGNSGASFGNKGRA